MNPFSLLNEPPRTDVMQAAGLRAVGDSGEVLPWTCSQI